MNNDITSFDIEVTKKCNMQCDYCYIGKEKKNDEMNNVVALHTVNYIKKKIIKNKERNIFISFWGGEPLLNFNAINLIVSNLARFGKNKHIDFIFYIITNGTILNKDMIDFFKKYNVIIQISLDGEESVHNSCRHFKNGHGTFDKVIDNLRLLIDNNMKKRIFLKSTFTKNNFPIQGTIDFFEKIGLKYQTSPALCRHELNKDILCSIEVDKEVKSIVDSYFREFQLDSSYGAMPVAPFVKAILHKNIAKYSCSAGRNMICIDIYGDIYFCHQFALDNKYKAGSIYQDVDLINTFNEFKILSVIEKEKCKKCGLVYLCGGSCIYFNLKNYNEDQDTYCSFANSMFNNCIVNILNLFKNNKEYYDKLLKNKGIDKGLSIFEEIKMNSNATVVKNQLIKRAARAILYPLDDEEGILYIEGAEEKKYIINTTAMAIWDLIDGQRTAQQITQEIADVCEVEFDAIKDDIYGQLAAFQELGLVEEVAAASHA